MNLSLEKRSDGWWITGIPAGDPIDTENGPYDTKAAADEDRRGLIRTLKEMDQWSRQSTPSPKRPAPSLQQQLF